GASDVAQCLNSCSRVPQYHCLAGASGRLHGSETRRPRRRELYAEVGDGLTGRRRRIVGVFEPPLLQQRSDTPCPMLTSSSCFSQGRSPTRSPRCCATERAPYWPKRLRPRWRDSSPSMSI